mgnify:CR=1 FL=1
MNTPNFFGISEIIDQYDTLLFDAYGVLVDRENSLPNAVQLINYLNQIKKNYLIVTNNASAVQGEICQSMRDFGFSLTEDRIISSGSLLKPWMQENGLDQARCLFMGNESSYKLLDGVNCEILKLDEFDCQSKTFVDCFVICSQADQNYKANLEKIISYFFWCIEQKKIPKIIIPNPDLIYPKKAGKFGIVSGMVTLMLQEAVNLRFPSFGKLPISTLGKPSSYIFEKSASRFSGDKIIMIGDQMETDIRGAHQAKIDSALISGGIVDANYLFKDYGFSPTYLLKNLSF